MRNRHLPAAALLIAVTAQAALAQGRSPGEQAKVNYAIDQEVETAKGGFREEIARAREAVERGDYALARKLWRDPAQAGFAPAQLALATLLAKGQGGAKDASGAAAWLERAARQGFAPAQFALGLAYLGGRGVRPDDAKGAGLVRQAAQGGLPQAQYDLAVLYETGRGLAKDEKAAGLWYGRAAAAGLK